MSRVGPDTGPPKSWPPSVNTTAFPDRASRPGASANHRVELEPHSIEIEAEAAVGEHDDGVTVGQVVVIVGAKSAPITRMAKPLDATRPVGKQRPAETVEVGLPIASLRWCERGAHGFRGKKPVAADGGVPVGHVGEIAPNRAVADFEVLLVTFRRGSPVLDPRL